MVKLSESSYIHQKDQLHQSGVDNHQAETALWAENVLLTSHWWIALALSIVPWILWYILSQEASRSRLLYCGLLVAAISSFLDFLGIQLGLWNYYYELFPWFPAFLPYDWALIPVIIMGLIEYKPHFSPTLKAVIFSVLSAGVGGALFEYFNYYNPINWSVFYSTPIYVVIYFIGYWASTRNNFSPLK